jgi:hypothetical protein
MSARPTSGSEVARAARGPRDPAAAAARASGWRRGELAWERMQEAAHMALARGDTATAARLWRRARWLGLVAFRRRDPRRVIGLANAAFADLLAGRPARARRRYAVAARRWQTGLEGWVAALEPRPRARSSLFHLRLELRHRLTYAANMRRRLLAFGAETGEALADLAEGRAPARTFFRRWRGEKPPLFDDTRRFLAAALLLAVPEPPAAPQRGA